MIEPIVTASAIAGLVVQEWLKTQTKELGERLIQTIWHKMQGNPKAESTLAAVEQGSQADQAHLAAYLEDYMRKDLDFARQMQGLVQQINAEIGQGNSEMQQFNLGNATGWQTKVEGGTAYIGNIHIHQPASENVHNSPETFAKDLLPAKKILILTANPIGTSPLRLDQEVRDIREGLRRASQGAQFAIEQQWAVRPIDVRRAMLDVKPQIVHFSGHGAATGELALENRDGTVQFVSPAALAGLFELFTDKMECVVLNACYSEIQADAIVQHIPYVVGMGQEINDDAAIEFAVAFYDALGAGEPVEFAYRYACNAIQMAGIAGHLIPVLKKRNANP
jgi:CHAT domain